MEHANRDSLDCGAQLQEKYEIVDEIPESETVLDPDYIYLPERKKNKKRRRICLILFLLAAVPVCFVLGVEGLIHCFVREVPLESAYWQSDIFVEALKTFQDSDWKMPKDARLLRKELEDYRYIDHYEEYERRVRIGSEWTVEFEREPVYATRKQTKYYYEYDAWVDERTVTLQGGKDDPPHYGELTLGENERERERCISYYVTFCYRKQTEKQPCSEAEYYQFVRDGVVRFRIRKALRKPEKEFVAKTE